MLAVPNLYQTTLELGSETKLGITLNKNEVKDYLSGFANESFSLSLILFVIYCHIGERTTRNRENQRQLNRPPLRPSAGASHPVHQRPLCPFSRRCIETSQGLPCQEIACRIIGQWEEEEE